ncbi:MAG: WG repeat-containing protein [Chitinophagaceae bacterium]|nr:MAG: WG repeat-containing protein [Chitinophagaceae bacterium]
MLLPWYDEQEDLYGYADEDGRLLIPVRYREADSFDHGIASVQTETGAGVIDEAGRELVPPRYQHAFTERGWTHAFEKEGSAQALFDRNGRCRLRLEGIQHLYPPEEGYVRVKRNNRWGVLQLDGTEAIPFVHRSLGPFWQGRVPYFVEGGWGWLDANGRVLVPGQFAAVGPWDETLWWGHRAGRKFEVFNLRDERVSPFELHQLDNRIGPAGAGRSDQGLHFFGPGFTRLFDLPQVERVWPFREGRALVLRADAFGFIDEQGAEVIEARYAVGGSFSEGLAHMKWNGGWGYINPDGSEVIAPRYRSAGAFSSGLAPVALDGDWGYIDREGKVRIPFQFSTAGSFYRGLATVGDGQFDWKIDTRGVRRTRPEDLWD